MRTAPGFSPRCKNRRSLRLYESCEEDKDLVVEALATIVFAIKETEKKSLKKATMVDEKLKNSQI